MAGFTTKNNVIGKRGPMTVRVFDNPNERGPQAPVLLIPSIINRAYIFDMPSDNGETLVGALQSAGHSVYVIDWGEPRRLDAGLDLESYSVKLIKVAMDAVQRDSGATKIQLFGYCLGGTFALIAGAYRLPGIASIVALTTPVDFSHAGELNRLTAPEKLSVRDLMTGFPVIPGPMLWTAFQSLDPLGLTKKFRGFLSRCRDKKFVKRFVQLETWLSDSVDMTGKVILDIVEKLYQRNALINGQLRMRGKTIQLEQGSVPVLNLIASKDHLVPAKSSLALKDYWGGPVEDKIFHGGHLGIAVGSKAPENMWSYAAEWLSQTSSKSQERTTCHV
ncbi:MAG: alpha/beta fold hydrolase [Planctomycetota bacterium]|nr:alpha/beta fold hydrolase [Planctomycetota bacterium]